MEKKVTILGIRGIPAAHGGFETFAEKLALYLVSKGWEVVVYCQVDSAELGARKQTSWNGVELVHIPVKGTGAFSTVIFDLYSIVDSLKQGGIYLTLGYNTAIFNFIHVLFGKVNIINMDGIEWKRKKWGALARSWFWLNEKFGMLFGSTLVADHPEILSHLSNWYSKKKLKMIPYGADFIEDSDESTLDQFGLTKYGYYIVIARPEPENSILEIVSGFSKAKSDKKIMVLGEYNEANDYHRSILAFESEDVIFPGAIYDKDLIASLRHNSLAYVHGHQVGGTNPSLVEGMAAGAPIIAHNNIFNRWVAPRSALFFDNEKTLQDIFESDGLSEQRAELSLGSMSRFESEFSWGRVLDEYHQLILDNFVGGEKGRVFVQRREPD